MNDDKTNKTELLSDGASALLALALTGAIYYLLKQLLFASKEGFLAFFGDRLSFTSFPFYLFAAYTVLLYYLAPKRRQWIVAMLMSIAFYASYGVERLPFILASSLIAYFAARKMDRLQQAAESPAEAKKKCKPVLYLALTLIVGILLFIKLQSYLVNIPVLSYIPWFISKVYHHWGKLLMKLPGIAWLVKDDLFTDHGRMASTISVLSSLGVSYYTFSLISYVADVYWRKDRAETNYLHLLAFTIYFPKILQGPISRHKELAPQLFEGHRFDYTRFCFGVQRMVWGYFKKLVIADRLAIFVNTVFGNIESETGAHLLVAAAFFAAQSYCDFSGCMDIAAGFSECLGLKLAENFNHPFFSKSAAEFWRRWHITLGTWFKDYVYMPLMISPRLIGLSKRVRDRAGTRAGKAVMSVIPLLAVWFLTGFWHGTGLDYIAWGLYWGIIIIIANNFAPEIKKLTTALRINTEAGSWKTFQMVRTFLLFMLGRLLTAFGDLSKTCLALQKIFNDFHMEGFFDGSLYTLGLDRPNFLLAVVCIFVLWSVSMLQERGSIRERIAGSNIVFRWAIYYIAFFSIIIFGIYGPGYDAASFIYMQY